MWVVKTENFLSFSSKTRGFLHSWERRNPVNLPMCAVLGFQAFARNVNLSITQCLSSLSKWRLTFNTRNFCVLLAWRSDTGAGFIQALPSPPNLPVKLLHTLLALGDGTMRPAQEVLPRDPDSGSDIGIRNSCPQSLASFPSGQLCYTPATPPARSHGAYHNGCQLYSIHMSQLQSLCLLVYGT